MSTADLFWHLCSCSSPVPPQPELWISCRMFHPEGSFSVIWHLFNICSPTAARQCGLFTAGQPERKNDLLIEGTGFMWSAGQCAADLEVGATCEMEIKVWPSIVEKYRDLWLKWESRLWSRLGENLKYSEPDFILSPPTQLRGLAWIYWDDTAGASRAATNAEGLFEC